MKNLILIITLVLVSSVTNAQEIFDAVRANDRVKVKTLLVQDEAAVKLKTEYGDTPLHIAALVDDDEIARLLIEQGADTNKKDHFGNTALHLALRYPQMVRLLLDSGAEVNAKNALGNTPLHLAVADKRVVEILLAAGANVNAINGLDKTPLHYAVRQGTSPYYLSIVETLILAGAK